MPAHQFWRFATTEKFAQIFFVAQNRNVIDALAKKLLLCFLEDWEDPSGKPLSDMKNRVAQFQLAEKYDGMFISTTTRTSTARSSAPSGRTARATRSPRSSWARRPT